MGAITRTFANQIKTGGKLDADGLDLTDTFAFTGTVTGAGGANTPAWFVTKTAVQSVSHNTETVVSFETEEIDTDSAFSSNTTFTVPSGKAGKYFAFGQIRFESSSEFAFINAMIEHNSTNVVSAWNANNASGYTTITVHCMIDLAETDTLKLKCRQQSGGSLNLGFFDRGHVVYFGGYKIIE